MSSYYELNKEKILARKKKYDQENKDKISQYNASYYKRNYAKISARKKELYQEKKGRKEEERFGDENQT